MKRERCTSLCGTKCNEQDGCKEKRSTADRLNTVIVVSSVSSEMIHKKGILENPQKQKEEEAG